MPSVALAQRGAAAPQSAHFLFPCSRSIFSRIAMYYDPRLGGMQVMYAYPYGYNPAVQANTGMGTGQTTLSTEKDTRQSEFANLFT